MAERSQPRKDTRSVLRKAFDTVEGAVANRAEPMARSSGFARVLGVYVSVNRGVRGVAGKATGGLLHLVNIPTTGDVGKLHQHLASVDSHLAALMRDRDQAAGLSAPDDEETDEETDEEADEEVEPTESRSTHPLGRPAKLTRSKSDSTAGAPEPGSKTNSAAGGKRSTGRKSVGG